MIDINKVIKGLECCLRHGIPDCKNCPYEDICYHDCVCRTMCHNALDLLVEYKRKIEDGEQE